MALAFSMLRGHLPQLYYFIGGILKILENCTIDIIIDHKFKQRHPVYEWLTGLIIINSTVFLLKAAMLHAQQGYICPWATTIMATRGIAYSPLNIAEFSPSGSSFSIKNILNLSDETVEKQPWISKDDRPVNVLNGPSSAPALLVAPRAVFPPGYHRPHLPSCLPGLSLPSPQPVVQINPFIFPTHVGSFGKFGKIANRLTLVTHFCLPWEWYHAALTRYSRTIAAR